MSAELDFRFIDLAEVDDGRLDQSVLDAQERRHAAGLDRPDDRRGYIAVHVRLRELLGERLGVAPDRVAFRRRPCPVCGAPHGRPELDAPTRDLHFSLSRSAGIALIAVAPAPVGVDVEAFPERETVAEVSGLLHEAEQREIRSAAPTEQPEVFARIWTRKEAYLKGRGVGVTHDLAADCLGTEGREPAPTGWTLVDLPAADGYAAAAALSDA